MSNRYMRGFMIGSLMGVAAGMLLMPKVDLQTKRKIMHRGIEMVESAAHRMPKMASLGRRG